MSKPRPYRSDVAPPLTEETDAFGHLDYVASLRRAIETVRTPSTLGLLGAWGTGKSRILKTVIERVKDDHVSTAAVIFDVWKYEEDSLRREFVRDLGNQLEEQKQLKHCFNLDKHLQRLDADVVDVKPTLKWSVATVLRAVALAALAFAAFYFLLNESKELGKSVLGALAVFVLTALGQAFRIENIQVTRKRLQDSDEFAHAFEGILNDGLKADRLVVGIDNLDRCSPDRVTELLGTIKAFLEPAKTNKELVFLLAADDAALRRHLIAQELAASGGKELAASGGEELAASGGPESQEPQSQPESQKPKSQRGETSDRIPDEVRQAVDEYLRKFFNGVLRVTDFLDTDIRDFTRDELEDFIEAHGCSQNDESQLVELVASALKQNPRRIKQFINGVELRLELLRSRKDSGRIQIDPDVLVVAKLAIIEEEWAPQWEALRRDPSLLPQWHDEARADRGEDAEEDFSEHDWQTFLFLTEPIEADDLQPYLRLQQSREELRLPRYREFCALLEDGRRAAEIDALLRDPDVAPQADEYRAEVIRVLRDRAKRTFYGAAVSIVRSSIEAETLEPIADQILAAAIPDGRLRTRLADISFDSLFARANRLGDEDFNKVVGVVLEKLAGKGEGASETRKALCEVLVRYESRLDQARRKQIGQVLSDDEIKNDFDSYAALAEAAPSLFPPAVLDAALEGLGQEIPWPAESPKYRVAKALLADKDKPTPSEVSQLGDTLSESLFGYLDDHEEFDRLARSGAEVLPRFDVPQTKFDASVERFDSEWEQIPEELRPITMDVMGGLLDAGTVEMREAKQDHFVNRFFEEHPEQAIEWAKGHGCEFGNSFETPANTRVALLVSGENDAEGITELATDLVQTLPSDKRQGRLVEAVDFARARGRYVRSAELLNHFANELGPQRQEAVNRLLDQAEQDQGTTPEIVLAAATLDPAQLSDEQRTKQRTSVAKASVAETGNWRTAYETLAEADSPGLDEILTDLFDHVASQGQTIENHLEQVDLLATEQHLLTPTQLRQLGRLLISGIERAASSPYAGEHLPSLAASVARLSSANHDDRRDWVSNLIQREREQADISMRENLLRSADALAGPHGAARDEIKERVKQLKKGTDEEKALAERLEAD